MPPKVQALLESFRTSYGLAVYPCGQGLPLRIVLRFPVLAPGVEMVAARILRQRMQQQRTLHGLAGHYEQLPHGEVRARLLFTPGSRARGQRLQRRSAVAVTGNAARVPRPL